MTTNSQEERAITSAVSSLPTNEFAEPIALDPMLTATIDPRQLVRFLHDKVKLTDREIATATGAQAGTVRRWRSAKATHTPRDIRPLDDMRVIVALLVNSGVLSLEEAGGFLRSRVVPPNDDIPLRLLAKGEEGYQTVREVAQSYVDRMLVRNQHRHQAN